MNGPMKTTLLRNLLITLILAGAAYFFEHQAAGLEGAAADAKHQAAGAMVLAAVTLWMHSGRPRNLLPPDGPGSIPSQPASSSRSMGAQGTAAASGAIPGALLLAVLGLAACPPSPDVVRGDVATLASAGKNAGALHKAECSPPASPTPGQAEPATCKPLTRCAQQAQEAAQHCRDAINTAASGGDRQTYAAAVKVCQAARDLALSTCRTATTPKGASMKSTSTTQGSK